MWLVGLGVLCLGFLAGRLTGRLEIFSAQEWGTVADWVGGVGTTAAVVFAGIQFSLENARERQREEQVRRASAAAVVVTNSIVLPEALVEGKLTNGGGLPIFQVLVFIHIGGIVASARIGTVAGGDSCIFRCPARGVKMGAVVTHTTVRFLDSFGGVWESSDTETLLLRETASGKS